MTTSILRLNRTLAVKSVWSSTSTGATVPLTSLSLHRDRLRHLHSTPLLKSDVPDKTLSQGHAKEKGGSSRDTHAEAVKSGMEQNNAGQGSNSHGGGRMDAALPDRNPKPQSLDRNRRGNPEGVGFAEQVGSQSSSADRFSKENETGNSEEGRDSDQDTEAATPGLFSTIKAKLGLGTDAGDVKQNRGGGHGVSGTGTTGASTTQKRGMHTARPSMPEGTVGGMAHFAQKDKPSPVDYVKDVVKNATSLPRPEKKIHNIVNRERRHASVDEQKFAMDTSKTVSIPKRHPHSEAIRAANTDEGHRGVGKPSGDWSTSGPVHSEYRNMSVNDAPYETPSDDTDATSKEDVRMKRLRYGGLGASPDII